MTHANEKEEKRERVEKSSAWEGRAESSAAISSGKKGIPEAMVKWRKARN